MSQSKQKPRGKLIVIEGLDKAGKSTQCARLVKNLQDEGQIVRHRSFPDRTTPIGRVIDSYLKGQDQHEDHVIHLLFSANRWEAAAAIESDIDAGITTVIDRYYYSGCVYSAAKNNSSLDLRWALQPEIGLPRPDACIFLDVTASDAAKRGGFGEEKYEKQEMQDRVRELFSAFRDSSEKDIFVTIDAGEPVDEVEKTVLEVAKQVCKTVDDKSLPLRHLEGW